MGKIKVIFWEDAWLMDHPPIEDFEDTIQVGKHKQMYGTLVGHYWHNNTWVNLIDVDQIVYNIQISLNFFSLYTNHEDEMIWNANPSG